MGEATTSRRALGEGQVIGRIKADADAGAPVALAGAKAWVAEAPGAGLTWRFPAGTLADAKFLTIDLLLTSDDMAAFNVTLRAGQDGPAFNFRLALLPHASARLRLPMAALDQNRWMLPREGALLKPMCGGARLDPARADRMTFTLTRKGDAPVRWLMTEPAVARDDVPQLRADEVVLPRGPLLDELGQSATRPWPGKTKDLAELRARLEGQLASAPSRRWPASWSRWGGDGTSKVEGAATRPAGRFFRTHHDGRRWWLVDPDGHRFWSAGQDCVRASIDANAAGLERALALPPEKLDADERPALVGRRGGGSLDYLRLNFRRALGPDWEPRWATVALAELRRTGFNTVGNWSDWAIAAAAGFPYVRPLDARALGRVAMVYRDFPDVFSPEFARAAETYARQLEATRDDPALIGYFLMNEPTWGFSAELPAAGMLYNAPPRCATRTELARHLRAKYADDAALSAAWQMPGVTAAAIEAGPLRMALSPRALADLADFSTAMVTRLFSTLTDACRKVDPNHLNLGARYHTVPPPWALKGMSGFDVFSINCYQERPTAEVLRRIEATVQRPTLVGEFHFGALDVGLPASGIGRVATQADRGRAYRAYVEHAASIPQCVGAHHFTLYDQSALGRFDGECYNIGFVDVCHRPYEELCAAARATHERLYAVASGRQAPFDDPPRYLPKLFC